MKYLEFQTLKTPEELMASFSEQGIRILKNSTEDEVFFRAPRTLRYDLGRASVSYVIDGALRRLPKGTAVRFRVLPGLSSLLTILLLLGLLIYSVTRALAPESSGSPMASPVFLGLLGVSLLWSVLSLFLRRKEVRDDFLRLM